MSAAVLADECDSCGEDTEADCSNSKRPCHHHCNCVWVHDHCHWCGAEVNDDGELIVPLYVVHLAGPDHDRMLTGLCGANHKRTGRPTFTTGPFASDITCPECLPLVQAERARLRAEQGAEQ